MKKQGTAKITKGSYGYISYEKKRRVLITLGLFALPVLLFVIGLIVTKTRNNILTVFAVVGCLPACKSLVGVIMVFMQKGLQDSVYKEIQKHAGELQMCYELLITGYEKSTFVDAFAISGNTVVGYISQEKADIAYVTQYVQKMVRHNGYKVDVKVLRELPKFLERLDTMNKNKEALEKDIPFEPVEAYPQLTRNEIIKHTILALSL